MARQNLKNDVDKLLEIASRPKELKVKKAKTYPDIDKFIEENNILAGKKRIPNYIIYYKYYLWKTVRLASRRKFITYFKTKFEQTRTSDGLGFLLDPKGFDLTPQGFFRARAFLRKERDEQKEKSPKQD